MSKNVDERLEIGCTGVLRKFVLEIWDKFREEYETAIVFVGY